MRLRTIYKDRECREAASSAPNSEAAVGAQVEKQLKALRETGTAHVDISIDSPGAKASKRRSSILVKA